METQAHTTQVLQMHNTINKAMVTEKETKHNIKYPSDVAVVVLVSNESHWDMLPHHSYCVHNTLGQMPAGSLAIACSSILNMYFFEVRGRQKNI